MGIRLEDYSFDDWHVFDENYCRLDHCDEFNVDFKKVPFRAVVRIWSKTYRPKPEEIVYFSSGRLGFASHVKTVKRTERKDLIEIVVKEIPGTRMISEPLPPLGV